MPTLGNYLPNETLKANKRIAKRDRARVKSGTPSASSMSETKSFDTVTEMLELTKNELIKVTDSFTNSEVDPNHRIKIDFGNILNLLTKASKAVASLTSSFLTTSQINELQTFYDDISPFASNIGTQITDQESSLNDTNRFFPPDLKTDIERVISFGKRMTTGLDKMLGILSSKLLSSGNDINAKIMSETSGINAVGAGRFIATWVLEKGAPQYQNTEFI